MNSQPARHPAHERPVRRPDQFGRALRSIRLQLGMTQAELAEKARVTRKWLSQVENGKRTAELGLVCRVVSVLGYEIQLVPAAAPSFDLEAHIATLTSAEAES